MKIILQDNYNRSWDQLIVYKNTFVTISRFKPGYYLTNPKSYVKLKVVYIYTLKSIYEN